jgi:hypothetical protein
MHRPKILDREPFSERPLKRLNFGFISSKCKQVININKNIEASDSSSNSSEDTVV